VAEERFLASPDGSIGQVDCIQMVTCATDDLNNYFDCSEWYYLITSKYASRTIDVLRWRG